MNENPFLNEKTQSRQENLDVSVEIALPKDWETYKNLRVLSLSGEDKDMMGSNLKKEEAKTREEWIEDIINEGSFVYIARNKQEAIGIGHGVHYENDNWILDSLYIVKSSQEGGIGRQLVNNLIQEVKKRNGKRIFVFIKKGNIRSLKLVNSLGFKESKFFSKMNLKRAIGDMTNYKMLEFDLTKEGSNNAG